MSQNTENIEAKLCAYVDGDLDAQGKLEIEMHLQANPQHRLLLEELRQTKVMMQALPREVAPPELTETIHGQLERSVLLDGVGTEDPGHTMKINRWPQLMAVAAVVLLAAGLGILVYVILPKHADTTVAFTPAEDNKTVAEKPSASTELGPVATKGEREELGGAKFADNPVIKDLAKDVDGEAAKKESKDAFVAGGVGGGGGINLNAPPVDTLNEQVRSKAGDVAPAAPVQRVYVVLSTDNLATTNEQVAKYLATNKISWSQAPDSMKQVFLPSRLNATTVQLRESGNNFAVTNNATTTTAGVIANNAYNGVASNGMNVNGSNLNNADNVHAKVASKRGDYNDNRNADSNLKQQYQQFDMARRAQTQNEPLGQSQVAAAQNVAQQPAATGQLNISQQAGAIPQQQATDDQFTLSGNKESMIVARGITREQAVMLCDSLGKLYAGQTAIVVDRNLLDELPSAGQQVDKALADKLAGASATTQPAAGEGEKAATWSQSPAAGYDRAFKPSTPAPAVDAPATQPANAPAPLAADLSVTTRPAEPTIAGGALGGGVSQPTLEQQKSQMDLNVAPTTRPTQGPLEVVIVVQPAAGPAPAVPAAVAPTTEPSVTAAPTPAPATQPAEPAPNDAMQNAK